MSTSGSILPATGAGAGCSGGRWRPPLSPRMMNTDDGCTILLGGRGGKQWLQPMVSFQPGTWRLMAVAVSVPVSITGKCLFTARIFNLFLNIITVIISWEQAEDRLSLLPASTESGSRQGCRMSELPQCITPEHIGWANAQTHMGSPSAVPAAPGVPGCNVDRREWLCWELGTLGQPAWALGRSGLCDQFFNMLYWLRGKQREEEGERPVWFKK